MTLTTQFFFIAPSLTSLRPSLWLFLTFGRCFKTWILIISQYFLIVSLCPDAQPCSFNFQKTCWNDFNSHCSLAEEYSSLSFAATLFTSLAQNATKFFISFGRIKRQSQSWWSRELEDKVTKRCEASAAVRV